MWDISPRDDSLCLVKDPSTELIVYDLCDSRDWIEVIVGSKPSAARPSPNHLDVGKVISGREIIEKRGLDAYLFLRYLITLLKIFVPLAVVILPVIVPLNLTAGRGAQSGVSGLDQLSWTNVSPAYTNRYWAHLVIVILVVVWVCRIARIELLCYTRLRY